MTKAAPARHYPNRFARLLIEAMQAEIGSFSTEMLLKEADLPTELPSDDLERVYPFDNLSALNETLIATYGEQGGRALAVSIGRAWFTSLSNFGAFGGFADPAYQRLPPHVRTGVSLRVLAEVFTRLTDQAMTVEPLPNAYQVIVPHSAFVFDDATAPVCQFIAGLLGGCLDVATGGLEYVVREVECRANGGARCVFSVSKQPIR
jgi:predicted hydrocarbon binding protein